MNPLRPASRDTERVKPPRVALVEPLAYPDDSYRANARKLQKNFAQYHALDRITCHIEPFLVGRTLISSTS